MVLDSTRPCLSQFQPNLPRPPMLRPNAPTASSPLEIPPYKPRSAPVRTPSTRPHASGYTNPSSLRSLRPSTAPAATKSHEDLIWLPAAQSPADYSDESERTEQDSPRPLQTLVEDDAESRLGKWANLVFDHEHAADGDVYSLNPSQSTDTSPMTSVGDSTPGSGSNDYEWAAFIIAYAEGRWDPHKRHHLNLSHVTSTSWSRASLKMLVHRRKPTLTPIFPIHLQSSAPIRLQLRRTRYFRLYHRQNPGYL